MNGLKSLGKSTLTRELTGTTDLQSKFQRLVPQGEQLPVATKGPYFPMLGSGFTAFLLLLLLLLFIYIYKPAGRSVYVQPRELWPETEKSRYNFHPEDGGDVMISVRGIRHVLHNLT